MTLPENAIGAVRFEWAGKKAEALLSRGGGAPPRWTVRGLSGESAEFVAAVLNKDFDPIRLGRGPSDGVFGFRTVHAAARWLKGQAELAPVPDEAPAGTIY